MKLKLLTFKQFLLNILMLIMNYNQQQKFILKRNKITNPARDLQKVKSAKIRSNLLRFIWRAKMKVKKTYKNKNKS